MSTPSKAWQKLRIVERPKNRGSLSWQIGVRQTDWGGIKEK